MRWGCSVGLQPAAPYHTCTSTVTVWSWAALATAVPLQAATHRRHTQIAEGGCHTGLQRRSRLQRWSRLPCALLAAAHLLTISLKSTRLDTSHTQCTSSADAAASADTPAGGAPLAASSGTQGRGVQRVQISTAVGVGSKDATPCRKPQEGCEPALGKGQPEHVGVPCRTRTCALQRPSYSPTPLPCT